MSCLKYPELSVSAAVFTAVSQCSETYFVLDLTFLNKLSYDVTA